MITGNALSRLPDENRSLPLALAGFGLFMLIADTLLGMGATPAVTGSELGGQTNTQLTEFAAGTLGAATVDEISGLSDRIFSPQMRLIWLALVALSLVLIVRSSLHAVGHLTATASESGDDSSALAAGEMKAPVDTNTIAGECDAFLQSGHTMRASEMNRLVYKDELTGLDNHRMLDKKLIDLIAQRKSTQKPFALGLINLDGFKPINDLYGHSSGDEILRQVAQRLETAMEGSGFSARLANDEFAVLMTDVADDDQTRHLARRISDILAAPYELTTRRLRLSAPMGIALFPRTSTDPKELIGRAGSALYQAKKGDAGSIVVFSRELADQINENLRIEQALRRAIAEEKISSFFQPIVDLQTNSVLGFEALARWTDKELGVVPPARFIPIAEQRGLIGDMTDVLLYQSAKEARAWPRETFLSFNLSTTQLADPGTALKVQSILSKADFDPRRLEVEITETAIMSDTATAKSILDDLRRSGVRVALDDFGTGYSSLGYLRELDLDKVKIDRSFVADIGREGESDHIVKAILEMCTGLNLAVVAEGIEEEHQATDLRAFGCGAGQGFLFGRPMNAGRARDLMNVDEPGAALAVS